MTAGGTEQSTALDKLVLALEAAQSAPIDPPPIPDETSLRRNAARAALSAGLQAIWEYLVDVRVEARLRSPLLLLITALEDANRGLKHELLAPAEFDRNTERLASLDIAFRSMVVEVITILRLEKRLATAKATSYVARALSRETSEIRGIYKRFAAGRVPDDLKVAVREYRALRAGDMAQVPFDDYVGELLSKARLLPMPVARRQRSKS